MREAFFDFIFIFLAALPGRTTFILFLMGASSSPSRVLIASLPAFVIQCLIGVTIGQFLKELPPHGVQLAAGLLFFYFSLKFWSDSRKIEKLDENETQKSLHSIFILFFMAELGDVSQLAIASRAVSSASPLRVFIASSSAMCAIAFLAVYAGRQFTTKIAPSTLQKIAAFSFFFIAAYLVYGAIWLSRKRMGC